MSSQILFLIQPFASYRLVLLIKQVIYNVHSLPTETICFDSDISHEKEPKLLVTMAKQLVWRSKLKVMRVTNQNFYCNVYLKI